MAQRPFRALALALYTVLALACLHPIVPSWAALLGGIFFGLLFERVAVTCSGKFSSQLLAFCIVGLGAGMNLTEIGATGLRGLAYTFIGILFTLTLGTVLGRKLKVDSDISTLIGVGTAICGGSAIAAVAPVIRAKNENISVALATVFILNATALVLFPWIGHHFHLTDLQFGLWSALAIHDTSSVIGSAMTFGGQAVEIATTVKLARALWIIPVAVIYSVYEMKKASSQGQGAVPFKKPWLILGFIITATLVTTLPELRPFGHQVEFYSRRMLVLTLFLIGSGLTRENISKVGLRPFIQGATLWFVVALGTLAAIINGVISR